MWSRILTLLFVAILASPPSAHSQGNAADIQAVTSLERQWEAALLNKDQAAIDKIVASDCVFVGSNGELMTKAQADEENRITSLSKSTIIDIAVRVFGDVAVVVGSNMENSVNRQRVTTGWYRWTDVWVRRDGRWQVVSAQSTKVD